MGLVSQPVPNYSLSSRRTLMQCLESKLCWWRRALAMFNLCVIVCLWCRHLTCSNSALDFSGMCSSHVSSMSWDAMSQIDFELMMFHLGIGTTQAAKACESDQVKLLLELKADTSLKDWAFFAPRKWKFPKTCLTAEVWYLGLQHRFGKA